jgi:hypothetical protein
MPGQTEGTAPSEKASARAHGNPSKEFFVDMVTRDISLADCIFDLLDNSIDGAHRTLKLEGKSAAQSQLDRFHVAVAFDGKQFTIKDDCGGMSLTDAIEYAFHFGRRKDAPHDVDQSIGLYGIGMKRAIFKIGRYAEVKSSIGNDSFRVVVDVEKWMAQNASDWDFDIFSIDLIGPNGLTIDIQKLHPTIANAFLAPAFANDLIKRIARDYAFLIQKGLAISVNERNVPEAAYTLKSGNGFEPAVLEYVDDGVRVKIMAGLMADLPDDIPEDLKPEDVERFGWYVVCNDRVVIAADKTDMTVWGDNGFQVFHPQYRGFGGFAFFYSDDAAKLPWTTTKRDIEREDLLYRRAVAKMKDMTRDFIRYSNVRKANLKEAKLAEQGGAAVRISELTSDGRSRMAFRQDWVPAPNLDLVNITYQKPRAQIKEVAESIGNSGMSNKAVGEYTFEYFRKMEIGKE